MQDLESVLTYCLRQEVAIHQDIGGESLEALQHFVRILAKVSFRNKKIHHMMIQVKIYLVVSIEAFVTKNF